MAAAQYRQAMRWNNRTGSWASALISFAVALTACSGPMPEPGDGDEVRQLLMAIARESEGAELRLDPRLVPVAWRGGGFADSSPEEVGARRAAAEAIGIGSGNVEAIFECLDFFGWRLAPVPDSITARMRACSLAFPFQVAIVSERAEDAEGVYRRVYVYGSAGYRVWLSRFDEAGGLASLELERFTG